MFKSLIYKGVHYLPYFSTT